MPIDQNKSEIAYLPRSWGPSQKAREKNQQDEADSASPAVSEKMEPVSAEEPAGEPVQLVLETPEVTSVQSGEAVQFPESGSEQTADDEVPVKSRSYSRGRRAPSPESSEGAVEEPRDDAPDGSDAAERINLKICGIRFGYASKIYHFESGAMELTYGDWVVVKTEKGLGLGQVALPPFDKQIHVSQLEGLRKIIRKGGKVDLYQKDRCREREAEARMYCLDRIEELGLPMKLVGVECFFDGSKYVFYFTAEGRVDFRELVKQLVARFPVRIEMRQIGVRHEAKMTGGLAGCGQELCCSRFLTDFRPVSVKMAKNQNLSLNPTKISGVCGRLMCCLGYEHDTYEEFSKGLPKVGRMVKTQAGDGLVIKHNPLEETLLVKIDEETQIEVRREDIICEFEAAPPKKEDQPQPVKAPRRGSGKSAVEPVGSEIDKFGD
jgi:cell fate regulator YaaT (PSP1 superfamily)